LRERYHREPMVLVPGALEPLARGCRVARHAFARAIQDAQAVLAVGVTLLGGAAEVLRRLLVVFGLVEDVGVEALCRRVSGVGGALERRHGGYDVAGEVSLAPGAVVVLRRSRQIGFKQRKEDDRKNGNPVHATPWRSNSSSLR